MLAGWLADPLVAKTNVKRCLFSRIFHFDCAPDDGGSCGSFVVVSLSRSPCGNVQLLLLLLQPLGYCLFTHVSITQSASRRGNIIWGPTLWVTTANCRTRTEPNSPSTVASVSSLCALAMRGMHVASEKRVATTTRTTTKNTAMQRGVTGEGQEGDAAGTVHSCA